MVFKNPRTCVEWNKLTNGLYLKITVGLRKPSEILNLTFITTHKKLENTSLIWICNQIKLNRCLYAIWLFSLYAQKCISMAELFWLEFQFWLKLEILSGGTFKRILTVVHCLADISLVTICLITYYNLPPWQWNITFGFFPYSHMSK